VGLDSGAIVAGQYRVVRRLAEGGMGAVYVAEQLSTGRERALKVMKPELVDDAKSVERFVLEARVGSKIDSDHVVEVVGAGVDAGQPWLAMELLSGETLRERVEREGPLAPDRAREVFAQLGHALSRAHRAGLVHRDLKPENLFLATPRREGVPFTVKLLDFGIAKLVQEAARNTMSGTQSIGSPLWMAPEQANAQDISPATDVWALGLLAFYALTGLSYWKAAKSGVNMTGLLVEILIDPLEPPSVRAASLGAKAELSQAFDRWFARCVARDPSGRYRDASEATSALLALFEERSSTLAAPAPAEVVPEPVRRRPSEAHKRPSGLLWAGIALAVIGIGAIVLAAFFFGASSGREPELIGEPETLVHVVFDAGPPPMAPLAPREDAGTRRVEDAGVAIVSREVERPVPIARTPHARVFHAAAVRDCWQESAPHAADRLRFELTLGPSGTTVGNVRVPPRYQGTPFAACVVRSLPRVRFDAPPPGDAIVLNLPAVQP
jgi:tRNA A-37 threonylcarbamoyl transferase component Bud32